MNASAVTADLLVGDDLSPLEHLAAAQVAELQQLHVVRTIREQRARTA